MPDPHRAIELLVDGEKDHINGLEWRILLYGIPFPSNAPYILSEEHTEE